jgi:hypothetical protein
MKSANNLANKVLESNEEYMEDFDIIENVDEEQQVYKEEFK